MHVCAACTRRAQGWACFGLSVHRLLPLCRFQPLSAAHSLAAAKPQRRVQACVECFRRWRETSPSAGQTEPAGGRSAFHHQSTSHPPVYPSTHAFIHPSIHLSIMHLSIHASIFELLFPARGRGWGAAVCRSCLQVRGASTLDKSPVSHWAVKEDKSHSSYAKSFFKFLFAQTI